MEISQLTPKTGKIELQAEVVAIGEPRSFNKFGKEGRVATARLRDHSGECDMSLWNDEIEKVKVGDTVKITNGWCDEFRGEKQVSAGRFGKLEIISSAGAAAPQEKGKSATDADEEEVLY